MMISSFMNTDIWLSAPTMTILILLGISTISNLLLLYYIKIKQSITSHDNFIHELGNILTIIKGYTSLLITKTEKSQSVTPDDTIYAGATQDYLDRILQALDRGITLVDRTNSKIRKQQ